MRPRGLLDALSDDAGADEAALPVRVSLPAPRLPNSLALLRRTKYREVPVTELRTGDVLRGSPRDVKVRTIEPCTQRGYVHVNDSLCFDLAGYAEVKS